ncbi:daptide biosynthesis RiPP recognition protein [Paenarthrobacter sp. NCHU4564]|uniref:daptide biosynthesis RiPP recognition protein n=1 Tax=Paenarthrobacter sp. NCHU4564 TaxID=3451353 RepID=UPI003F94D6B8
MTLTQQQATAAAVDQWITGIPGRIQGPAIFVENPDHAPYAKKLADRDTTVLVLGGDAGDHTIVPVSGAFAETGEELLIDGSLSLEIQDYVAIPFINLVGVTVVRMTTREDWQAFFDDADAARSSGHFIQQLTEVNAVLAERALLSGLATHSLVMPRLHITGDGRILNGPYGTRIGQVGDPLHELRLRSLALHPESSVAAVSEPGDIRRLLRERPWLPRYLAALDAWKFIPREERAATQLVGFGLSLYGALDSSSTASPDAPFILHRGGEHTLLDPKTGRLFKIGKDAATIVEAVSNLQDFNTAAILAAPALGVPAAQAESSVRAVVAQFDQLGIDILGVR